MNTNTFLVEFDLTADQVNALDTTPITLATIGASGNTSLVRVPIRAEIWRDAGTAYTVDNVVGRIPSGQEFNHLTSAPPAGVAYGDAADINNILYSKALWIRSADSRGERGPIIFKVPAGILENTVKCGIVVMPEAGQSFVGGTLKLTIESGTGIASGTGALHGRLYFEEYALPI
jgi:hypothetical protein